MIDAPRTLQRLRDDLADYRPELAPTESARDAAIFLLREPPLPWAARPGYWMLSAGAVAMLPPYARDLFGSALTGRWRDIGDALTLRPLGQLGTAAVGWALEDPRDIRNTEGSSQAG